MLIKVFGEIVWNLSQHQNNLCFSGRQITKFWTFIICHVIRNIFSNGFSVMKNLFVKWASGDPGFGIEATFLGWLQFSVGHTGSWAIGANKISARVSSTAEVCAESGFLLFYFAPVFKVLTCFGKDSWFKKTYWLLLLIHSCFSFRKTWKG